MSANEIVSYIAAAVLFALFPILIWFEGRVAYAYTYEQKLIPVAIFKMAGGNENTGVIYKMNYSQKWNSISYKIFSISFIIFTLGIFHYYIGTHTFLYYMVFEAVFTLPLLLIWRLTILRINKYINSLGVRPLDNSLIK
jgi:hypothetical protein